MLHRGRTRMVALAAVASLLLVGAGCSKVAEKATEKMAEKAIGDGANVKLGGDGNVQVQTEDGSFSMSGEDGTFKMESEDGSYSSEVGKIPLSWPDDVPLPPEIEVQSGTQMMEGDGQAMVTVTAIAAASAEDVMAFYAEAFGEWEETYSSSSKSDDGSLLQVGYEKNNRSVMMTITESEGRTNLNITHAFSADE